MDLQSIGNSLPDFFPLPKAFYNWERFSHRNSQISNSTTLDLDLLQDISYTKEIQHIVNFFQSYKAPGPDGLHLIFFQKYWHTVASSTTNLCQEAFILGKIPKDINHTYVCLIPKMQNATSLKDFRPISFCNCAYKIITKILARRLRSLMEKLIGLYQSSFLQN